MKFIISSQTLLKHLQLISGVIAPNNALPILENFLFEINNEKLTLRSTDLDCTMETNIGIESNDTGTIAIDAKMLLEFLKAFPEQPLTFIVNNENNIVKVISEDGEYSFSFYDGNEFPKTPTLNNEKSITINSQVFLKVESVFLAQYQCKVKSPYLNSETDQTVPAIMEGLTKDPTRKGRKCYQG